jgi:cytochrome oxidase Cu insertion factor (SCO1/SenC/PrrC family)
MRSRKILLGLALLLGTAGGVAAQEPQLGPKDGHDLAAVDTGRVGVGDTAPDFALGALDGSVIELSDYRGSKNVILVFYRGHW